MRLLHTLGYANNNFDVMDICRAIHWVPVKQDRDPAQTKRKHVEVSQWAVQWTLM